MNTEKKHRQITKIKLSKDLNKVIIQFTELEETEFGNGEEDEEGSSVLPHVHTILGRHRPAKDFIDAMKGLRKFALDSNEMTVDSKELPLWTVSTVDIAGDMFLKQSRVVLTLAKMVKRTGKVSEMKLGQITMYPEGDDPTAYKDADKLTKAIEVAIVEAWEYLNGKYDDADLSQLPLFPTEKKLETNFDR
jgi:hypothetical protein